jgi:hypothetical protein
MVDDQSCNTPCSYNWMAGSVHSIAATPTEAGTGGTQYVFANWSDSGAASHSVTTPSTSVTYTANFTTQHYLTTAAGVGGAISPPSGWFDAGSVVQVSAVPHANYIFSGFSGGLSGAISPQNVTMSSPVSVTASFVPGGNSLTLVPNVLNLVAGETRTIQALDAASQPVTGLTWTSSNQAVVSLSSADPPVLTAVAPGHVTITAGTASADVTVFASALPLGTVLWSNPGNGSRVSDVVSAVPSPNGIADVFVFRDDSTVQAITSDGATAWTADLSGALQVVPDFDGGLLLMNYEGTFNRSITRLDGITGQPVFNYIPPGENGGVGNIVAHPDGTIFAVQEDSGLGYSTRAVVGIDCATGAQQFNVPLPSVDHVWTSDPIVAGDGYAYVAYSEPVSVEAGTWRLSAMRISTSGVSETIPIANWASPPSDPYPLQAFSMITNSDRGVVLTWETYGQSGFEPHMAALTDGSASLVNPPAVPIESVVAVLSPVLQAQDGSFVGTTRLSSSEQNMGAFDAAGNVRWIVTGYKPKIATADGGVIAATDDDTAPLVAFDQNGNATGQIVNLPTQSWRGNLYLYQNGAVARVVDNPVPTAQTLWAQAGANPSRNGTAARRWYFKLVWLNNCSSGPAPCGFTLYPKSPPFTADRAIDVSSQAITIKTAALDAFRKAFDKYPVDVSEGSAGTGDHRVNVLDGYDLDRCGRTPGLGGTVSDVFYRRAMEEAQRALPIVLVTAQDVQNALSRVDLMKAIGSAIGNNAAHELAHQFLLDGYGMDDTSTNTYNGKDCYGDTARWVYGFGPIAWEDVTASELKKKLGAGRK